MKSLSVASRRPKTSWVPATVRRPLEALCHRWGSWIQARPGRQTALLALFVYLVVTGVYFALAPRELLTSHTRYNHFSHLAAAWLEGRLDLPDGPPSYAQNNDFARFGDKWFVTFPPFPAVILLPFVAFAGGEVELVRDGQVFLWVAGLGPALLLVALERLRQLGHSRRTPQQNVVLAFLFAFATVFFFTALQGTVWFAAHVVGVALAAAYLVFSIDARFPVLAGVAIGLGWLTRAPLIFAAPLFALEALRVCGGLSSSSGSGGERRWRGWWEGLQLRRLLRLSVAFALPILVCLLISFLHNQARFGDPFDTGYQHLTVAWQARMKKWGLFHYHYLARNLAVVLSSLPWTGKGDAWFRINAHGLALWFTTPLYLWLLWPKRRPAPHWALWATVAAVAMPALFYQNTGWAQFGYRFSNDYAVFLFALLALGDRRLNGVFAAAALWAVVVNGFGAVSFGNSRFADYYYYDGSQQRLFEPD